MNFESTRHAVTFVMVTGWALLALFLAASVRPGHLGLIAIFSPDFDPSSSVARLLVGAGVCFMPLILFDAWRASRAIAAMPNKAVLGIPAPLVAGLFLVQLTPIWLPRVTAAYGPIGVIGAYVWWPIGTLSLLAYVVAASQVDAESRGEKVRTMLLTALYQLGGALGVVLASHTFSNSKALKQFPDGFPKGMLMLLLALGFLVFSIIRP
jgi:hypothetical protein